MTFPAKSYGMTGGPLHKGRCRVLFSVRRARIIPWLIVWAMFALFTLGLVCIIKGAHLFVTHSVFPAIPGLNQLMDGDSELAFW